MFFKRKNPKRLLSLGRGALLDTVIDISVLREKGKTDKTVHGLVVWKERESEREEYRFDLPSGEALPAKVFDTVQSVRAQQKDMKNRLMNRKGKKVEKFELHQESGYSDFKRYYIPGPEAA
jgi:hypothetical protein